MDTNKFPLLILFSRANQFAFFVSTIHWKSTCLICRNANFFIAVDISEDMRAKKCLIAKLEKPASARNKNGNHFCLAANSALYEASVASKPSMPDANSISWPNSMLRAKLS